jgi:hypothetical protein
MPNTWLALGKAITGRGSWDLGDTTGV